MIIGIIGLGLIGGSVAKSVKRKNLCSVFAADIDAETMTNAKKSGVIDENLTHENISKCDLIFLALAPSKTIEWIKIHAKEISTKTTVIDLCGIKRAVCDEISPIARENNFKFIGGHPMAGLERGGFENSKENLYEGASMILTPTIEIDSDSLEKLKKFFLELGFSSVIFSTPEEHDKIIAYTSHLAHVISSAYVKTSENLKIRKFTAGSFRDMTRVSKMNEKLWTELFFYNRDFLIEEIELAIKNLNEYLDALKENNPDEIEKLIIKGRELKAAAEGD